ncbi:MAG: hypothetical protein ACP6IU_06005 [Candidatus Asgardarchaeia archaeon]
MDILSWLLSIPWLQVSWGFFISGIIFTVISVISASSHGDTDLSHDTDYDLSHDMDFDHDISMDHDLDVGHDVDISHDMDISHDFDVHADIDHDATHMGYGSGDTGTPLMLLIGTFLLMFGSFGIGIFGFYGITLLNISILFAIAFSAVFLVSVFWKKVFRTGTYRWRPEFMIGRIATVALTIDADGGSIKVDTHTPLGMMTYPARPMSPDRVYKTGEQVYVVAYKDGYAIVHDVPVTTKRSKH